MEREGRTGRGLGGAQGEMAEGTAVSVSLPPHS